METSLSEFHLAVRQGDQEKVHRLLKNGVNPNELDWHNNGRPALVEAVYHGHVDIAKLLLEHGADPIACNAQGETALHFSLHPQTFVKELVELLISKAKDLDAQEKFNGFSALHVASKICVSTSNEKLRTDMVEILKMLSKRSDLNLQNKRGETALHRVASGSSDWTEPAKVLIENGIDLDIRNERGETSLMCAIDKGHVSIAELLVQKGASLNLVDRHSQTVLHRCAQKNLFGLMTILLKNKADVNIGDLNGDTALHIASSKGLAKMVRMLVYHPRSNVNARNLQDETPLHNAIESGFAKVVEVLLEAECEIDSDNEDLFSKAGLADEFYVRRCYSEISSMLKDAIEQRKDWDVGETSL